MLPNRGHRVSTDSDSLQQGPHLGLIAAADGLALALCRAYTAQKEALEFLCFERPRTGRSRSRVSMNLMLSMPPGTDQAAFELAVGDFLVQQVGAHDFRTAPCGANLFGYFFRFLQCLTVVNYHMVTISAKDAGSRCANTTGCASDKCGF